MRLTAEDVTSAIAAAAGRSHSGVIDPQHVADALNEKLDDMIVGRSASLPTRNSCGVCGCTDNAACVDVVPAGDGSMRNCAWTDATRSLCDNPNCIAVAAGEAPTQDIAA
jgi:hypothetical protein